jgi:L-malate glycosyltransferase
MHIAFLTPEYPHPRVLHAAGIGTSIHNLATALAARGVTVTVFVYGQKEHAIIHEHGVCIHLLENQKYPLLGWFLHRKYIERYLNRYILSEGIALVEAPDWTGITAFMKLKAPLVIRFHGSDAYFCHLEQRKQKKKNFWFEKWALQHADAFIAPTTFAGEETQRLFGLASKKVAVIYNGLALHAFQNGTPLVYENGLILYVGTLIRKKGVLEFPAIFSKVRKVVPEARLVLIGSDSFDIQTQSPSTWELLEKEFEAADLEYVSYLGKKSYADVLDVIKKAHVCVFPSFAETFGMVTIEAMAMQKPLVNSHFGWAQEVIVDGESGYLVDPKDHESYAATIISLLQNVDLAHQMGATARSRVEAVFDIQKIAQETIIFYESLIKKS